MRSRDDDNDGDAVGLWAGKGRVVEHHGRTAKGNLYWICPICYLGVMVMNTLVITVLMTREWRNSGRMDRSWAMVDT